MNITYFSEYKTQDLIEMRNYQLDCVENDIEVISDFTLTDLIVEIARRNQLAMQVRQLSATDDQDELNERNPILDMGQSFIPKTAY